MFHQSSRWILAHSSCWGEGYQNVSLYAYLYNYLLLMHFMCFFWCRSPVTLQISCFFYQNSCFKLTCSEECFLGCHPSFLPSTSTFSQKKTSFVRLPTRPTENTWGSRNSPTWTNKTKGSSKKKIGIFSWKIHWFRLQKNAGMQRISRISGSFTPENHPTSCRCGWSSSKQKQQIARGGFLAGSNRLSQAKITVESEIQTSRWMW